MKLFMHARVATKRLYVICIRTFTSHDTHVRHLITMSDSRNSLQMSDGKNYKKIIQTPASKVRR